MMESGRLMIGYQPLFEKVNFFRSVLSNPAVEREDLEFLVAEIARLGEELELWSGLSFLPFLFIK